MTTTSPLIGAALAGQVATRLEQGKTLAYDHPEYCGMGLQFVDGMFVYAEVQDGRLPLPRNLQGGPMAGMEHAMFATRDAFIAWLAGQSDQSLSGQQLADEFLRNNQRITLERLQQFVA
jgi:hypothetical protein